MPLKHYRACRLRVCVLYRSQPTKVQTKVHTPTHAQTLACKHIQTLKTDAYSHFNPTISHLQGLKGEAKVEEE